MAWDTPVVDWVPADGIANTDLNRIEGNTLSNHNRFEVSANVHTAGTVGAGGFNLEQYIYFVMEDGYRLVLKVARYKLNSAGLRLRVRYNIGAGLVAGWTSLSHEGDEEADDLIYTNVSGIQVTGFYQIEAYNPTGGGLTVALADGWSLTFEKEEN
jgi:hypothetical protein